jgi:hypothetical protein
MADSAICFGVIGTSGDVRTVSPAPVTAQVMKTSRFMDKGMAVSDRRAELDGKGEA